VQDLPEAGQKVQSRLDPAADLVDPDPAVAVEQTGPVDNGNRADVPGPAESSPRSE
jgi:hypothetical protein